MFVLTCIYGIVLSKGVRLFTPLTLILSHTLNHTLNHTLTDTLTHAIPINPYPNANPNPQLYPVKQFLYSLEFGG